MSVLNEVLAIIKEYREFNADYIDIENLMYMRKQLATYGANLAVEVGELRAAWKRAELKSQVTRTQKQIGFNQKGHSITKSETLAKANTEELQSAAIEAENEYFKLDYIFRALREILGELNQRIAYVRDEIKQSQFYNDGN